MSDTMPTQASTAIKAIDGHSIHKITSGQVVIDLQTAVKELVENSLDAGATNIEVRFKEYGLKSIEVVDNGTGIAPEDHDSVALKHHTSKLSSFSDLSTIRTFGFRGEALSSLCALTDGVTVTTATAAQAPMGTVLEMAKSGSVKSRDGRVARQRGTTVLVSNLFAPLPVRRKELERNSKREFGKALNLLNAYALVPCAQENRGVRLTVSNQGDGGRKTVQLRTSGTPSTKSSVSALWGPKALDNIVDLDLRFNVEPEKAVLRRQANLNDGSSGSGATEVRVRGLISSFAVGCGRTGTDRQFFFVNGRPWAGGKVQKAFNEVYRTFNANQAPFVVADFILPTNTCDINVSPDKRTILLHSEGNLVQALKTALEVQYASSRSTFSVGSSKPTQKDIQALTQVKGRIVTDKRANTPAAVATEAEVEVEKRNEPELEEVAAVPGVQTEDQVQRLEHELRSTTGLEDKDIPMGEPTLLEPTAPALADEHDSDAPVPLGEIERHLGIDPSPVTTDVQSQDSSGNCPVETGRPPLFLPDDDPLDANDSQCVDPTSARLSSPQVQPNSESPTAVQPQKFCSRISNTAESDSSCAGAGVSITTSGRGISERLATKQKERPVQMVLSTLGASWNLRRGSDGDGQEPPRKKIRLGSESGKESVRTRSDLRSQLKGFARSGSRVAEAHVEQEEEQLEDEEEGADEDESNEVFSRRADESDEEDELPARARTKSLRKEVEDMDVDEAIGGQQANSDEDNEDAMTLSPQKPSTRRKGSQPLIDLTVDTSFDDSQDFSLVDNEAGTSQTSAVDEPVTRPEVIRSESSGTILLHLDLSKISRTWRQLAERLAAASNTAAQDPSHAQPMVIQDAGVSNTDDDEKAADALSRVIDKEDFGAMEIVGQFNLGFIVTRRIKRIDRDGGGMMDDLFIVDQHAADEKYNFETLQQTTRIQSQKLFRPQPLELTAADELLAVENMEILQQNGFQIDVDDDAAVGQGHRLKLVAQPTSKSTVFDMKDLEELLHLMQDRPTGQMVRCSKARAMFAMRACRKSVMVGMPLTKNQMSLVVQHMGTMDQPWNCPHGRPTMRHLSDIANVAPQGKDRRAVDWATFGPL